MTNNLYTVWKIAFNQNFNIYPPTWNALVEYDNYIKSLEERIKALEKKND